MPARRFATLAAIVLLALLPAVAGAQTGAGDEQYSDPFSGSSPPAKKKPKPAPVQQQATTTQQQSPSATSTQQQPAAAGHAATSPRELPRTGFDVIPVALAGVALIAAGLALRRRGAHGSD